MSTPRSTALAAICAATLALAWAVPAQAATQTFNYTGAEQTFTVPIGVTSIHVVAIGGAGGVGGGNGGFAAQVTADLSVTPGQTLYVEVGGAGKDSGIGSAAGGFNGGAAGGEGAGGGGGASDVRTSPLAAGLSPDHRLLIAGGGGGGGGTAGGAGGAGGSAEASGEEGVASGNQGGGPGTQITGGEGGFGSGGSGGEGQLGSGGTGGAGGSGTNSGGGGGAGYYGGGGGSGGGGLGGGGGGGGSSLVPAAGSLVATGPDTPAKVQIAYNPPPSIGIVAPANGATYTQGQAVSAVYSCNAGEGTGLKSCAGPVANGATLDTSTLGPHTFTVNAEDTDGGKATQSVTYTVATVVVCVVTAGQQPTVRAPCPGEPNPQSLPPDTILGSHPKAKLKTKKKAKVSFSFSSPTAGASFKCKLDKGAFAPCTSPKTYKVKPGKHTFSVEAVSSGGTDPTPATFSFKVKKKS